MHLMSLNTMGQRMLQPLAHLSGLPALAMRLILAPVFITGGFNMMRMSAPGNPWYQWLLPQADVVAWFGNSSWGLDLPMPAILAAFAAWAQFFGGWALLAGLLTRLAALPLIITMAVAICTVHWQNGWFAVAPSNAAFNPARMVAWFGFSAAEKSLQNSEEIARQLSEVRGLITVYGNPSTAYSHGRLAIFNDGIQFPAIYLVMLLSLFFCGGGRYVSLDYYLFPKIKNKGFN